LASTLEDKETIRETILRSCFYADMGELDAHVQEIFTEDCVVMVKGMGGAEDMVIHGRDAVAGSMREASKDGVPWRHYIAPLIVSIDGDTAIVKSYLLLVSSAVPPTILDAAYYDDGMVKREDGWKVHRRQILGQASQLEMF
jgi:hypothetical protein